MQYLRLESIIKAHVMQVRRFTIVTALYASETPAIAVQVKASKDATKCTDARNAELKTIKCVFALSHTGFSHGDRLKIRPTFCS